MSFAKLLIGWAVSHVIYAAFIHAWFVARGAHNGFVEGLIGLGILLAIPTFVFSLVVAWPTIFWLSNVRPAWLVALIAVAVLALFMWVLTSLLLPDGWRGAGQALVGYAAVLGFVLGCLNVAAPTSG